MTKTYLGYGYTNNRGVAKLKYNPQGQELTTTGYKNTHNHNTQITAQFTKQNKTYTSNTKQYEGITEPTTEPIDYYDNQSTDKRAEYITVPNSSIGYVQNGYLSVDSASLRYNTPLIIQNNDHWLFGVEFLITTATNFCIGLYSDTEFVQLHQYRDYLKVESDLGNIYTFPYTNHITPSIWNVMTLNIADGNISIYNNQGNISASISYPSHLIDTPLYFGIASENTNQIKNIKIKKVE